MSTTTGDKARQKEVTSALKGMEIDHIHCRDYGHTWAPFTAYRIEGGRGYDQTLQCVRCGTHRHRVLDRWGDVLVNNYQYADGYLVPGLGRLTGTDRGSLRLASIMDTLART